MIEKTFSIIKPDAVKNNITGKVNAVIESAGLQIVAQKKIKMTKEQAEKFYGVHKERPFFWRAGIFYYIGSCCCAGFTG